MAIETLSISRPDSPQTSLDFDKLFQEGISHIEALSGRLWTDFNSHDPGITIMELLCYAITELGYRSDFKIGDIVTPASVPANGDFFSLASIASNAPLTVNDYRKLLIDLPGIRNAWLEKADTGEVPVFFDPTAPQLRTYQTGTWNEVKIKGLYKVYVQFEENKDYGNLNDNSMMTEVFLELVTGNTRFEMEVEFPIWEDLSIELDNLDPNTLLAGDIVMTPGTFESPDVTGETDTYRFELVINPNGRAIVLDLTLRVISGQEQVLNQDDFNNNLEGQLDGSISSDWAVKLIQRFMERRILIQSLLDNVRGYLAEHRNLCEDFVAIYPMSLQEIGLDLKLEVEPGTNCEEVMAEAYLRMEQYLSPSIQFYSLREMLDKGYAPDQIFRGSVLSNGFIDEQELSFHQRRETLYTSDLIQEFMKIEGVKSVRSISLSRYLVGDLVESNKTECLGLTSPQQFLPRLSYTRSAVQVDDGGGRFKSPDNNTALDLLREKKALDQIKGTSTDNDFPLPEGTFRGLDKYHSIQHEFPLNFALGSEGLAPSEPEARKAQAKQLKAYMLFFEQLLADFLTQLSQVRKLFSYRDDIDRTYYTQALWAVPRVQDLIKDFGTSGATWEDYVNLVAPTPTHYRIVLDNISEDEATFHDRRHRFLNHLQARFNESFSEYAAYIFSRNFSDAEKYSKLIGDQVRFLRKYDEHSRDRGTSFNYQILLDGLSGPDFWNSDRVTGLKKRMVYHTGLPTVDRQYISPLHQFEVFQNASTKYRYRLTLANSNTYILYLANARAFDTEEELFCEIERVMEYGLDVNNWTVSGSVVQLEYEGDVLGIVSITFVNTVADGFAARDAVIERLNELVIENFHVIEHVILRPRESGFPTLGVRVVDDCPQLDIRDPYSFRISVVLPIWAGRFQEIDFRRLFKKIMRMETPAHVYIHFQWIDMKQMYHFENCWTDWLNGEWIAEDSLLLQELHDEGVVDGRVLQENTYNLLLDQPNAFGSDGIPFAHCLGKLKNLRDSYYVLEPARIVDQYTVCDLLGMPVDPDGGIIRAWLSDDSGPLPPGTCLNPCNGAISVQDPALLQNADDEYPVEIFTLSSAGEMTCHAVTIQFIANGPAFIKNGPLNQHEAKYNNGDVVLEFDDPDDSNPMDNISPIIQATLTSGTLPAGMSMDPLTGIVTVTNASLLVATAAPVNLTFKLMDEVGGVTFLMTAIHVIPDTDSTSNQIYDNDQNQDAFQLNEVLFEIEDVDGGIALVEKRPAQQALANLGLGIVYSGNPQIASIVIVDVGVFQTALTSYFNLVGTHYETTLLLRTTDGCGGTNSLNIPVEIYRDNSPTVVYSSFGNRDLYVSGWPIAVVEDFPDGGIASVSPAITLAPLGMSMSVGGSTGNLVVSDAAAFSLALDNVFTTIGSYLSYSFLVNTVDNTGGLGAVTINVRVLPDLEPTFTVTTPQNQDLYNYYDTMAIISDANGVGIQTVSESASTPNSLASLGMSVQLIYNNLLTTNQARIYISSYPQFQDAVENGPFVEVNATTKLHEVTVQIDTVDYTGGRGQVDIIIGVIKDYDGTVIEIANRQRVDQYSNGDVLVRMVADDANGTISLLSTSPPFLLPGLGIQTTAGGEVEVYVVNAGALYPTLTTFTFRVQDNTGGRTDHLIQIEIRPRMLIFNETVRYNGALASVLLQGTYPMISTVTSPYTNFGSLYIPGNGTVYFSMGTGFPTATQPEEFLFVGNDNGQPVEGKMIITRQSGSIGSGGGVGSSGGLASFGSLAGGKLSGDSGFTGLASDTQKLQNNVVTGKNYSDNPLKVTNPKLVGDYASGRKDNYVVDELTRLTGETSDKIVELQGKVIRSSGASEQEAREELESYTALYEQQLVTVVEYAAKVRDGDLEDSGKVEALLGTIEQQLGRFK